MRRYDATDERKIRVAPLVREWTRSGLLDKAQQDRIAPELKVGMRRTNPFLRLILFGFGILIIAASVALADVAAAHAAEGTSPSDDLNAPRAYREHLARVLVGRALEESASRA